MLGRRSSSSPVGVALVGCGAMATAVHVRALRRDPAVRLVAVVDPDAEARGRGARIGRAEPLADVGAALARADVEAVVVAAPSPLHAELAAQVLDAGRHLYLEKPVATAPGAARELGGRAAARPELVAVAGYSSRAHPLAVRARDLVRGGAIGAVRHGHAIFSEPRAADAPAWRRAEAGGVLLDLADHHIDLVGWLLDDRVVAVDGDADPDEARLTLSTAGGVRVGGFYSAVAARAHVVELVGTRGTLRLDRYAVRLELTTPRDGAAVRRDRPGRVPEAWQLRKALRPAYDPSWARSLAAFARAVHGAPHDLASIADATRNVELLLAAGAPTGAARSG